MRRKLLAWGMGLLSLATPTKLMADEVFDDLDQFEMVAAMGAGWNLGNTLEASMNGTPNETCWGNPKTSPALMKLVKNSGFNTIRIPVSYLSMIGPAPDYTIDAAWLARVQEVVDMALAEDMYAIINIHGDGYNSVSGAWLLCNGNNQEEIKAKYKAVWTQIATLFKEYDEHLIFESMNEEFDGTYEWQNQGAPYPNNNYYANLNAYNQIFVETVRLTGVNNAKRWLLIPGWNTDIDYTSEEKGFKIPNDTYLDRSVSGKRLMISVHYYAPWDLCGDDTDENVTRWGDKAWAENSRKCSTYGQGANSESQMTAQFDKLKNRFTSQGYPVVVGEYGTVDKSAYDTENPTYTAYWTKTLCENARRVGAVPVLWDNGHVSTAKGFATINRSTNSVCRPYIVEAINEAFGQEVEIDTTAPAVQEKLIESYLIDLTVSGAKSSVGFRAQYTDWSNVDKEVAGDGNYKVDLSPASKKDAFTNLGYIVYEQDSMYTVTINKITVNGYEFSNPTFAKNLTAAQYQNALPNIWSGDEGEYLSDNGKAILAITGNGISLLEKKNAGEGTNVELTEQTKPRVMVVGREIAVVNAVGKRVEVFTMLGVGLSTRIADTHLYTIPMQKGIYIVKVEDAVYKVVVR